MEIIRARALNDYPTSQEAEADFKRYWHDLEAAAKTGNLTMTDLHEAGPEGSTQLLVELGHHIVEIA